MTNRRTKGRTGWRTEGRRDGWNDKQTEERNDEQKAVLNDEQKDVGTGCRIELRWDGRNDEQKDVGTVGRTAVGQDVQFVGKVPWRLTIATPFRNKADSSNKDFIFY